MDTAHAISVTLFVGTLLAAALAWHLLYKARKTCSETALLLQKFTKIEASVERLTLDRRGNATTDCPRPDRRHHPA